MTHDPFAPPVPPEQEDPFAGPLFDPTTGEVLDVTSTDPQPDPLRPPTDVAALTAQARALMGVKPAEVRDALRRMVTDYAEGLRAERPAGPVTSAAVHREATALAEVRDYLRETAAAYDDASRLALECLQELTLEVRGDEVLTTGGSRTMRVPVGGGQDMRVTVTQKVEPVVNADEVLDVVVALATEAATTSAATGAPLVGVAPAIRGALDRYRSLISPPKWKITALQAWQRDLERNEDPAAVKLAAAIGGRRKVGNPSTAVTYTTPEEGTDDDA